MIFFEMGMHSCLKNLFSQFFTMLRQFSENFVVFIKLPNDDFLKFFVFRKRFVHVFNQHFRKLFSIVRKISFYEINAASVIFGTQIFVDQIFGGAKIFVDQFFIYTCNLCYSGDIQLMKTFVFNYSSNRFNNLCTRSVLIS